VTKFTNKLLFACVRFIVKYIDENIENFNTRLILSGYPVQMVEKTLWEVKYKDRKEALKQKSKIAEGTTTLCVGQFHSTVNTKLWKAWSRTNGTFKYKYSEIYSRSHPWSVIEKKITEIHACKTKQRLWATQQPHSVSRTDSFVIKSTLDSTTISTGLISSVICMTELSNTPKVARTQPKRLYWVISSRFIPN